MKFKVVTFVAPPHPPTNRASHEGTLWSGPGERGVPLYTRVIGMCCWMGSHFHDRIDYSGVTFSIASVEWGCTFADFWGKRVQDLRLANIAECLYCR